jgi:hypothetical protein
MRIYSVKTGVLPWLAAGVLACLSPHARATPEAEFDKLFGSPVVKVDLKQNLARQLQLQLHTRLFEAHAAPYGTKYPGTWRAEDSRSAMAAASVARPAYRDTDLKKMVVEFDRIALAASVIVDEYEAAHPGEFRRQFFRSFQYLNLKDWMPLLETPEAVAWVKLDRDFSAATYMLAPMAELVQNLAPAKVASLEEAEIKRIQDLTGSARYSSFARTNRRAYLRSVQLQPLLPSRFNLKPLLALDTRLLDAGLQIYRTRKSLARGGMLDAAYVDAANALLPKIIKAAGDASVAGSKLQRANADLNLLAERMIAAADHNVLSRCDDALQQLDVSSLRSSRGNWTRVKRRGGAAIKPGEPAMNALHYAYTWGCAGKRDLPAARRTLEAYAENHHEGGKVTLSTTCTVARWYRYAIGGTLTYGKLRDWGERAKEVAPNGCPIVPPIDPADPWRVLEEPGLGF